MSLPSSNRYEEHESFDGLITICSSYIHNDSSVKVGED